MQIDPSELAKSPAAWLIAAWFFREFWSWLKDNNREHSDSMKENTREVSKLTVQLVRLETKLEAIDELARNIPKIQQDINILHSRVRGLAQDGST